MRKICVVTGTRAEYGLLYWLLREIKADTSLELQLVVTGMHLSPEFGLTYREIEKDGFEIDVRVEMLLSSDTPIGIGKSIRGSVVEPIRELLAALDRSPDARIIFTRSNADTGGRVINQLLDEYADRHSEAALSTPSAHRGGQV